MAFVCLFIAVVASLSAILAASASAPSSATPATAQANAAPAAPAPVPGKPDAAAPAQAPADGAPAPGQPGSPLGGVKPPPEVQKEIDRSHAEDQKAAALREAAAAHPDDVKYQVDFLNGVLDLGRVDEALESAPPLVERFPKSADLLIGLGRALMRDGQFDVAGVQFQRALAIAPGNARAVSLLARNQFIQGDLKSAEAGFRKALSLDPEAKDVRGPLSQLLERTGRYAEALTVLTASGAGAPADDPGGRRTLLAGFAKAPPIVLPDGFTGVTVPFVTARGYPPFIKVKIGESFEKFFVIDTASDDTMLTQEAARALGLPDKGKSNLKDAEGREHLSPAYVLLDAIKINDQVIKRVPARVTPGLKYPDDSVAGSLGRDFLRRFRVTLDYPAHSLTLGRSDATALNGEAFDLASVILLDGFNGNDPVGKFVIDTSSYTPGAMDSKFVAGATGLTLFSQGVKPIKDGGPYIFKFTMPSLRVGGVEFTKFPATAVDLRMMSRQIGVDVRGVVGVSLLRQCRLEIDFKNQKILLAKTAPAAATPAAQDAPAEPGS
jgi:tetratricopeptide (TPR) repeat protein